MDVHSALDTDRRIPQNIGTKHVTQQGFVTLSAPQTPVHEVIPINEYVQGSFVPISHLAHDWELHSSLSLTPAEERTMVREPSQAVPEAIAQRLGKLRVLIAPYIACLDSGDAVCRLKPKGETHTAAWVETGERINLILPCRELDAHDTGFELLASIAELVRPRLTANELARYTEVLESEIQQPVRGEIDEEALTAKLSFLTTRAGRRHRAQFDRYRDVSFVSTLAEYMHGLWHDVQIRVGPDHLPLEPLRERMNLLAGMFPPNTGYQVFADNLKEKPEQEE
jgi:hypothetical protein